MEDGKDGKDGKDRKDGKDGKDGKDEGHDGLPYWSDDYFPVFLVLLSPASLNSEVRFQVG